MSVGKKIITGLVLAGLMGVGWEIFCPRIPDPLFRGKPLSYWLAVHTLQSLDTESALREVGTNAIPLLLHNMRVKDSSATLALAAWVRKHGYEYPLKTARFFYYEAVCGFRVLGPKGRSAVPELIRTYEENLSADSRFRILQALVGVGSAADQAIPLLIRETTNTNRDISECAMEALSKMDVQAVKIAPLLLKSLNDTNSSDAMREFALTGLGNQHVDPEVVVPVLLTFINYPDLEVQKAAVAGLGKFGHQADVAVSPLLELRKTAVPLQNIRYLSQEEIDDALLKIDPAAAAKAGMGGTNASATR